MRRVAVLIDGSNFIGTLYRANLGYPALAPLIAYLAGGDDLSYARFYGAPPPREPWKDRWNMFVAANRHVQGLDFFQGYRHASSGEEKAVDAAIVADLFYGKIADHFDRVAIIGGDGDYAYALKVAKTVLALRVYLFEPSGKGSRMLEFRLLCSMRKRPLSYTVRAVRRPTADAQGLDVSRAAR